ncbi:unnamed protein product [Prorocentrum cordatum]|uniref:Neurotransmitter-gated ion-channel ligand-binding domain-containing protein n=1 Tax=Prorocentrum cordatum TaxID=2364126 RepID=A0ABN9W0M2_9DINO|nr:unnamed protein product [Polarella glacialis]
MRRASVAKTGASTGADWPEQFGNYYGIANDCNAIGEIAGRTIQVQDSNMSLTETVEFYRDGQLMSSETETYKGDVDHIHKTFRVFHGDQVGQICFNSDFSVMKWYWTGHSFDTISLYFRATPPSPIAPDLVPGTDIGALYLKMKEALFFMHGKGLWEHGSRHDVQCEFGIDEVMSIDTIEQSFKAKAKLRYLWLAPAEDVYRSIIDPSGWEPTWLPPGFEILNAESEDAVKLTSDALEVTERNGQIFCSRTFHMRGTFHEKMELQRFPFDVQELKMLVGVGGADACTQVLAPEGDIDIAAVEGSWTFQGQSQGLLQQSGRICAFCCFKRDPTSYMLRVIFILLLINILTLGLFALDPVESAPDRMSIAITMLLTAVAYTFVVSGCLPELGYLTMLDKVVLMTFCFLAIVIIQVVMIPALAKHTDIDIETFNAVCFIADSGILLVLIIIGVIHIVCSVMPAEAAKLHMLKQDMRRATRRTRADKGEEGGNEE